MSEVNHKLVLKGGHCKYIGSLFLVFSIWIAVTFAMQAFDSAEKKDLWLDESWSLEYSVQKSAYWDILVNGASGQLSPAPLDYVFLKVWDQLRGPLHSFGLPFNVYYRLHPIFSSLLSGLIVIFLIYFKPGQGKVNFFLKCLQAGLLLCALGDYYFRLHNFFFSIEMRVYALWNGLWFLTMVWYVCYPKAHRVLIILFSFLALTATVSIFQMFSFALSFMVVELMYKENFWDVVKKILKIFIFPGIICLYYILGKVGTYSHVSGQESFDQYLANFFQFWKAMRMVPILSFLGILMTVSYQKLRSHTVIFLTIFILYFISPIINYITISRGVYFTHRQYRYYELIFPVFMISLAVAVPFYWERIKQFRLKSMPWWNWIRLSSIILMSFFLIGNFIINYGDFKKRARNQTLNRLQPASYEYLFQISKMAGEINKSKLEKYERYYQKIIQYIPNRPDAHGVLGFCLYHLGKVEGSVVAYRKAIEMEPRFFWFYHNLGTIYFKQKEYAKAVDVLTKALKQKPEHAIKYISSSKIIYLPLLSGQIDDGKVLQDQLKQGYQDCAVMLILSQQYLQGRPKEKADHLRNLRVF